MMPRCRQTAEFAFLSAILLLRSLPDEEPLSHMSHV